MWHSIKPVEYLVWIIFKYPNVLALIFPNQGKAMTDHLFSVLLIEYVDEFHSSSRSRAIYPLSDSSPDELYGRPASPVPDIVFEL